MMLMRTGLELMHPRQYALESHPRVRRMRLRVTALPIFRVSITPSRFDRPFTKETKSGLRYVVLNEGSFKHICI